MSWSDLVLPDVSKKKAVAAVVVGCSKPGRFRRRLSIAVRPDLLEGGLPWWTAEAWVQVQVGHADHAGWLRLSRGSKGRSVQLRLTGGKGNVAVLLLPLFPGLPEQAERGTAVEFDHGLEWLEVQMPTWVGAAGPPHPEAAASPPAAAVARAVGRPRTVFSMTGMTTPQVMR